MGGQLDLPDEVPIEMLCIKARMRLPGGQSYLCGHNVARSVSAVSLLGEDKLMLFVHEIFLDSAPFNAFLD